TPSFASLCTQHATSSSSGWATTPSMAARPTFPVAHWITRSDMARVYLLPVILDRFKLTDRVAIVTGRGEGHGAGSAVALGETAFEQALRFNVVSPFLLTRLVVPVMVERAGGGAVVNISSRAASMVQPCFTAYGTAKAGLSFMTRNMACELAPKVRVNAIEV